MPNIKIASDPDYSKSKEYKFLRAAIIISFSLLVISIFSSCSGSRKVTKSETKYDSTSVVKTETKKDSIVNTSTVTKTETKIDNDITSEDNYTEETTETTHYDTNTAKPISSTKVTKKTGIKKEKDATKTNIRSDVKDTTATRYKEDKKENSKATVSKRETTKNVDAQHGFFTTGNVIGGVGFILLIVILYFVYRWAKSKVK